MRVILVPRLQMLRSDLSFLCIILFHVMLPKILCMGVTIFDIYENVFTLMIHVLFRLEPCIWLHFITVVMQYL